MNFPFVYLLLTLAFMSCEPSVKPSSQPDKPASKFSTTTNIKSDPDYVTYKTDLKKNNIRFFWKNSRGDYYKQIDAVRTELAQQQINLLYAANGGIFQEDLTPLGLFIQDQQVQTPLNKRKGYGNFYVQPNGVFYITKQQTAHIVPTASFKQSASITDAVQSGPLLLVNGQLNSIFTKGSTNTNLRNGVGVRSDHTVVFSMSKRPVNFYDFANHFKSLGCKDALYLDGAISQSYCPEVDWEQTGGAFSVIIGVTAK
ncbi:MAG: phosphodiester glycosidase family protein [Ferruginibacter sp.]